MIRKTVSRKKASKSLKINDLETIDVTGTGVEPTNKSSY